MKQISAQEAYEIMQKEPGAIYVDVRSIPEFEKGHPARAINIPLVHYTDGMGMTPNADFMSVAESALPKDARIIVGCQSGGRSAQACQILERLGFKDVANVRSGFVGAMDRMGRIAEPGWSLLKLPLCTECSDDARYVTLSAKKK